MAWLNGFGIQPKHMKVVFKCHLLEAPSELQPIKEKDKKAVLWDREEQLGVIAL